MVVACASALHHNHPRLVWSLCKSSFALADSQQLQSQAGKPAVLSLSERLGPIVAPNSDSPNRRPSLEAASQPSSAAPKPIGVGSGLAAALAAAAGNMSPEVRKRPNEGELVRFHVDIALILLIPAHQMRLRKAIEALSRRPTTANGLEWRDRVAGIVRPALSAVSVAESEVAR